ncbi:MAG: spore germination protein [Ruthenibacterium lactatiformans]
MEQTLTTSLLDNKLALKGLFGTATDFYTKDITLMGYPACICMFEGLSSIERLWIMMLDVLSKPDVQPETPEELFDYILKQTAIPLESKSVVCVEDARAQLTAGTSVILIDGVARGLVLSTQSMQFRSVQEPSGEGNVRGSREGFTEPLRVNISLMRRLIRSGELMVETMTVGEHTKTEIALLYNTQLVPKQMLSTVKRRLESVKLPFLFDTGYLAAFLQKSRFSFFQSVGYTERPDTACAKICEGKIIIMANGSPFAMIVPYFFNENFQSMDDYSEKAYFASLIRILKYSAFLIAVMLPGVFVSVANFTPELLPPELLYKVASAELATPLPLFMEALFVNFLLEIVREAGLRLSPSAIGEPCGGAVVDAAVSAGNVGTCGHRGYNDSDLHLCSAIMYEPITVLRILYILAGASCLWVSLRRCFVCCWGCGMNFRIRIQRPSRRAAVHLEGRPAAARHIAGASRFSIDQLPGKETGRRNERAYNSERKTALYTGVPLIGGGYGCAPIYLRRLGGRADCDFGRCPQHGCGQHTASARAGVAAARSLHHAEGRRYVWVQGAAHAFGGAVRRRGSGSDGAFRGVFSLCERRADAAAVGIRAVSSCGVLCAAVRAGRHRTCARSGRRPLFTLYGTDAGLQPGRHASVEPYLSAI